MASHVDEFGTDLGGGSGTDHENGRQDHNGAELHASVNNESSQIMVRTITIRNVSFFVNI